MIPHRASDRSRLYLATIVATAVAVIAAASFIAAALRTDGAHAEQSNSTIGLVAVDVDSSGNTATSLGPIDRCVRVEPGASVVADVVVNAIPSDRPMTAFQFDLVYDPTIVNVTENDVEMLLAANEGFVPLQIGEQPPDSDGTFVVAILDYSPDSEPETGPGVLSRITLSALASGVTALSLTNSQVRDNKNLIVPIDDLAAANIAVGQDCPAGAPAPIIPSPATQPTPGGQLDQTAGEGPAPEPGTGTPGAATPGAEGTPTILPGTGGTPSASPGAPAPGDTPGASGTPGQPTAAAAGGAGIGGDGGDGVGAWIAAPIAAGVLALLAAGYVAFRRIRGRAA